MKVKLLLLSVIFCGIFIVLYEVLIDDKAVTISKREANAIATDLYNGHIVNSSEKGDHYIISIENKKGIYRLMVDGETRSVSNVKQIKKKEPNLLTMEEAKANIRKKYGGKVTNTKQSGENAEVILKNGKKKLHIVYDLKKQQVVSKSRINKGGKGTPPDSNSDRDAGAETKSIPRAQLIAIAQDELAGEVSNIKELKRDHGNVYQVTIENPSKRAHIYIQGATEEVTSISLVTKKVQENDRDDGDDSEQDDHDEADPDDIDREDGEDVEVEDD